MGTVLCTKCQKQIPLERYNAGDLAPCRGCSSAVMAAVFPAVNRLLAPRVRADLVVDAESSCFYHGRKRAAAVCDSCGRFLCSLCDIHMGSRHLCPACVAGGEEAPSAVENSRTLYETLAIVLAVAPLVVTPLASLYLALRHWGDRPTLVPRSRVRWYVAIVLALTQLGLWAWLLQEHFHG